MTFPLYTWGYAAAALVAAPVYLLRGALTGKYLWSLKDRLGLAPLSWPQTGGPRVWVHALSLGEVICAEPLATRLTGEGWDVGLSTTTRSGAEAARARLGDLPRFSPPLDFPPAVNRTISRTRPDIFVLVETDLWPNLLAGLKNQNIPAVWVNARISPRSLAGYRKIGGFFRRVLDLFAHIACQSEGDYQRLVQLGAPEGRMSVSGNMKFDRPAPETGDRVRKKLLEETGLNDGTWLVAGSTHPGEENILLDILKRLKPDFPDVRLLLAPRDRERFGTVWDLVRKSGLASARRSSDQSDNNIDVYLLDTLGELDRFYELAHIVFVGKSLDVGGEGGGHNLLEPAARLKPVLFGPRMHNFPFIAQLMIQGGGGRQVAGEADLEAAIRELLDHPERCKDMGRRAGEALAGHRGALERTVNILDTVLETARK